MIAQSGTANAMWATHVTKTPRALRKEVTALAEGLGCYGSDFLDCLRMKPWDKFRATQICEVEFLLASKEKIGLELLDNRPTCDFRRFLPAFNALVRRLSERNDRPFFPGAKASRSFVSLISCLLLSLS